MRIFRKALKDLIQIMMDEVARQGLLGEIAGWDRWTRLLEGVAGGSCWRELLEGVARGSC